MERAVKGSKKPGAGLERNQHSEVPQAANQDLQSASEKKEQADQELDVKGELQYWKNLDKEKKASACQREHSRLMKENAKYQELQGLLNFKSKTSKINTIEAAITHIKMLQHIREMQESGATFNVVDELRTILPEEDRHLPLQALFKRYPSFEKTLMIIEFWPESVHSHESQPCSSKSIRSKQTNVQKRLKSKLQQYESSRSPQIETTGYTSAQSSSIKEGNMIQEESSGNVVSTLPKQDNASFNNKITTTQACSAKNKKSNRRKSFKNKDAATTQQNSESVIQVQKDSVSFVQKVVNEPTEAAKDQTSSNKKKKTRRSKRQKGLINKDIAAPEQNNGSKIQAQQDNAPFEHKVANETTEGADDQPCSEQKKKNKRSKRPKGLINNMSALAMNNDLQIKLEKDKLSIHQKVLNKPMDFSIEQPSSSSKMISQQLKIEATEPSVPQQSNTLLENQIINDPVASDHSTLPPLARQPEDKSNQQFSNQNFTKDELDQIAYFDRLLLAKGIRICESAITDEDEETLELFNDSIP